MTWEDEEDRPSRRGNTSVNRLPFFPVLLIAFGAAALLHEVFGGGIGTWHVFSLAIGLFLISRSRTSGSYPLLIIGAVMVGSGAGDLIGDMVDSGASEAIGSFGTAAGFFWLANVDRGRSNWALIPAAIIALIGVGELGLHMNELARGGGGWLLPAGVVVAGIMLLGAHRMPGPLRLAGLVFVGAAALSLVTNQSSPRERAVRTLPTAPISGTTPLNVADKSVWLTGSGGDVTVVSGEAASVSGRGVSASESGDRVTITGSQYDIRLTVPEGTEVHIQVSSGDIGIDVGGADLDLKTSSGDINVRLPASHLNAVTSSGDVTASLAPVPDKPSLIVAPSGDIDLTIVGDPSVNATVASGDLEASGFSGSTVDNDHAFIHQGEDGQVTVTSGSGDVSVRRTEGAGLR